jgi:hypothetical protein
MDYFAELRRLEQKHRRHFSTLQQATLFDAKQRELQNQATYCRKYNSQGVCGD